MDVERKFAVAMPTLVGQETWYLPLLPISTFRKITGQAGISLDYWPIRFLPEVQGAWGLVSKEDLSAIVSASGSFRSEGTTQNKLLHPINYLHTWEKTLNHPNRKLAIRARLLLPFRDNFTAVHQIAGLKWQGRDETKIPLVVYPQTDPEYYRMIPALKVIQPTPEDFIRERIKTAANLDEFLERHRVDGFCFDILHSRFLFNDPSFKHLFEEVVKRTKCVHISLGRDDINRPDYPINGQKELKDVYYKNYQTEVVELLRILGRLKPDLVYVFEIPSESIKKLNPSKSLNPKNLSAFYKYLTNICLEILGY